jgi:NADH-quinone oxidoreductase subunit M
LILGSFASLGLPGLANFVGEFTVFLGAWKSFGWFLILGIIGLLLDALVFLRLVEKVLYGERKESELVLTDLSLSERLAVFPLILATLALGVFPAFVFNLATQTINALVQKGALK